MKIHSSTVYSTNNFLSRSLIITHHQSTTQLLDMKNSCCTFQFFNVQTVILSCSSVISMTIFSITHLLVITFCATSVSTRHQHNSVSISSSSADTLRNYYPPLLTVQHGDRIYEVQNTTLQISNLENNEFVYFICKAPYPIEWTLGPEVNQSAMGRGFLSHLSISRSFSDFQNKSSYIFTVTSRLRYQYKSNYGIKTFRFSCQSVENPKELCILQSVSCRVDKDLGLITLRTLNEAHEDNDELCRNSLVDLKAESQESECDSFIYYREQEGHFEDDNDKHLNVKQGPKYSFMCKFPDGKSGVIKIHYCANAMVCNSLYKTTRMPRKCAKAVGGNFSQTFECDSCPKKVTRLFTGFIGCASNEFEKKIDTSQLLIFFSVPQPGSTSANIHFSMDAAVITSHEVMSVSRLPAKNYMGDQLFVTCNVSNHYFAEGASIALKYKNNELSFLKTMEVGIHDPLHNNGFGVEEANIPIMYDTLERVYCFAPLWNSFSWLNKSRDITVEDIDPDYEFQSDSKVLKAVAITFSVAVAIFASFFAIFWLRIVNRKHTFKLLSIKEVEEFRIGNSKRNGNLKSSYEEVSQSPYDESYEIQRERLLLDETAVLERGHFGLVIKGILKDDKTGANNVEVAVKTIKTKMDVASLKALLSELKIMASIGKHPNICNLLGACTKKMAKGELFVAVEFCHNGNLQNYLRSHRKTFHNQVVNDYLLIEIEAPYSQSQERASRVSSKQDGMEETLTTLDLVRWAWEIARGMEFLSSKKVKHGDLATRNIILTADKVAKVCDFGLSRQLVDYYYVKKETGPMPWKWMAIESLRDMKFSVQSDVWSYGITLWEIFSLAEVPYSGCSWSAEFVITLLSGHRLGRPAYVTTEMYDLMRECWNIEPNDRPSFFTAKLFFEDILTQTSNLDYMQIQCSQDFNLEGCFQKLPLLRITEALSPEEDEVFE